MITEASAAVLYARRESPVSKELPLTGVPRHVLIIPDNNRTWAKARKEEFGEKYIREGYNAGARRIVEVAESASRMIGLDYLTVNLASRDNILKRPENELKDLWDAVKENMFDTGLPDLVANGARIRVIGNMEGIPDPIKDGFTELIERSKNNSGLAVSFVIGYDKDQELDDALAASGENASDGATVRSNFYLPRAGLPDINAVIRTGDEERTSGIFPYAIAGAEILFVKGVAWPEFDTEKFKQAISSLSQRKRKSGG